MNKAILFGNGMNQVLYDGITWNNMLDELASRYGVNCSDLAKSKQYTMVYEQIVICENIKEIELKEAISKKLSNNVYSKSYRYLLETGASSFLTTNYEHYLEEELKKKYLIKNVKETENIYSIRRKVEFETTNNISIWNIHGSIRDPKSIMLGLDHYCGYIGKIDAYIKGHYSFDEDKENIKIFSIEDKLKQIKASFDNSSWIEHFFKSDLFILGLGMAFVETDLWWILNKRARMKKSSKTSNLIHNKIVCYGDFDNAKKNLLESFGVEVVLKKDNQNYDEFFLSIVNDIKNR